MEYRVRILSLVIFASIFSLQSIAQVYSINIDTKTAALVGETQAAQLAVEEVHNTRLSKIDRLKKKIAGYSATMATLKEAYRATMQNVDGFGAETRIYKEVFSNAVEIAKNIPIALQELRKRPYSMINCYKDIMDISLEATSAVNTFVNVVNNGRVSMKIKDMDLSGTNDGYNFLNRTDRYVIANSVLTNLQEIKYKLEAVIYISRFCNGISDIVYSLDPESWCNFVTMSNQLNMISNDILALYKGS